MLLNADTAMSENCGECGIILTPEPYTRTTVVFKCVWSLIVLPQVFCVSLTVWNNLLLIPYCHLYPCGKIILHTGAICVVGT